LIASFSQTGSPNEDPAYADLVQLFCFWTKNNQLVVFDIIIMFSKVKFDWNPLKNTSNQA